MRHLTTALLLGATMLAAPAAWADTVYNVAKVTIVGSKTVPNEKLYAVIQEHPGQKVTVNDIIADRDAISKVLEDAHVGGAVKPSVKTTGTKSEIIFSIEDQGVQAPVVTKVAPKLDAEIFDGNVSIPSDKLAAASGINPGDDLSNEKIAAAQAAIMATYKAAKLPVNVSISGENKVVGNGKIDVYWHIVETKGKKQKKKNDGDDAGQSLAQ
jgi:outer membrane protein assembly factor BamA